MFDDDRCVRSATSGADALLGVAGVEAGLGIDDLFAASPELRVWVQSAADGALEHGGSDDCVVTNAGAPAAVRVEPLGGAGAGFVLVATPAEPPAIDDDRISQKAWHDIKNQLGGLKLYATFLKMRIGDTDELARETAQKIVGGVDSVVEAIARVRSGEGQTKGEQA